MPDQLQTIKNLSVFQGIPDEAIRQFSAICVNRKFAKGEMIYFRGGEQGKAFLLISGEVKIYQAADGRKVVIQVLTKGDFFGDLSFAHPPAGLLSANFAQAENESQVCVIEQQDLSNLLSKFPSFAMVLLVTLRNRLHQAESKIKDLAISSAETRLINELIRYAVYHGKIENGFYIIGGRLTHQALAEMIGVARETVTKTLRDLQKLGFVKYSADKFIKLNIEKITSECLLCLKFKQK